MKTQKIENAKKYENAKKKRKRKKAKTHKKEDAQERISIGALYKSLQIMNISFIYKKIFRLPLEISIQHIILMFNKK